MTGSVPCTFRNQRPAEIRSSARLLAPKRVCAAQFSCCPRLRYLSSASTLGEKVLHSHIALAKLMGTRPWAPWITTSSSRSRAPQRLAGNQFAFAVECCGLGSHQRQPDKRRVATQAVCVIGRPSARVVVMGGCSQFTLISIVAQPVR